MDKNGAHILTKQQAVPHLIHSAIRMFVHEDDPFAIHVLIHAADSILNDIIENRNTELKDWNNFIPINRRREFLRKYRELYNYLKHADRDADAGVLVEGIMLLNALVLGIRVSTYAALYGNLTKHMTQFKTFSCALVSNGIKDEGLLTALAKSQIVARDLLEIVHEMGPLSLREEAIEDRQQIGNFYTVPLRELRATLTTIMDGFSAGC